MNSTDQTTTITALSSSEIGTTANNNNNTTAPRLQPDNTTTPLFAVATAASVGNSSADNGQRNVTTTADINRNTSTTSSWSSSSSSSSSSETSVDAVAVANTSTSTTTTSTTQASTTIPVFIIPVDNSCLPINDTYAVVNSSDVREGAVISVTCRSPAKLLTLPQNQNVFYCNGAHWRPLTPQCRIGNGANVGVIVGCTLGGVVCLLLVIAAIFVLYRSIVEKKMQKERSKEFYDKMDHICSYVNSSFQDSVGMPVLTMDNRDSGLRGRVSQTANDQSSSPAPDPDPNEAGKLGADLF